jgi:hypothetical protein
MVASYERCLRKKLVYTGFVSSLWSVYGPHTAHDIVSYGFSLSGISRSLCYYVERSCLCLEGDNRDIP